MADDRCDTFSDLRLPLSERLPIVTYTNLFAPRPITTWISPQVERLTGYQPQDWVRDPGFFESVLHPDDRIPVLEAVFASRRELVPFSRDYRLLRRDGEIMWIHDESVPILDPSGRPDVIQGYFVDVTARYDLEQQLMHAQKLDALGRFASHVAHDFNNYLTAISGHLTLLERRLPDDDDARRHAREIAVAATRASDLSRRLLTYGRDDPASPRYVDVAALIRGLEPMLATMTGPDVHVELDIAGTRPVRIDPSQLEQVLTNLVANAGDAMPDGGTVTVSAFELDVQPGLMAERFDVTAGRYVAIAVADTGTGIDPATQARMFEPFFTTKDRTRGTGLGLAIVCTIVRAAGGGISVRSAPGAGTRFRVLLPAAG